MRYMTRGKDMLAEEPASEEDSTALIARSRPILMSLVGYGGFMHLRNRKEHMKRSFGLSLKGCGYWSHIEHFPLSV